MKKKEASARIKINRLLEEAGWRFFDDENGPANIQLEPNVKMSKADLTGLGENFDKVKNGFADFLLLDDKGKPFIVLEAKAEDKDPLVGKEQAREYAKSLYLKYVILSNGNQHYFWNIYKGNPQLITVFPSYGSIRESKAMNADPAKLYSEEIGADYIAVIKNPRYMEAPEYINPETRQQFLYDNGLRFLRQYQINALKALQESVRHGNQRFLFEMATGTGKTLTSAAVIRLFLRSGNANRVLFLVDRIELENQAKKNFQNYLVPDYHTVIFKENVDDWRKAEVVVSTVQTLIFPKKYLQKCGIKESGMYNQIANYVYTQSEINIKVKDQAPKEYMAQVKEQCTGVNAVCGGIDSFFMATIVAAPVPNRWRWNAVRTY